MLAMICLLFAVCAAVYTFEDAMIDCYANEMNLSHAEIANLRKANGIRLAKMICYKHIFLSEWIVILLRLC